MLHCRGQLSSRTIMARIPVSGKMYCLYWVRTTINIWHQVRTEKEKWSDFSPPCYNENFVTNEILPALQKLYKYTPERNKQGWTLFELFVIEFLHWELIQEDLEILNSVTSVSQVCFLVSHFYISIHIHNWCASLYFSMTTTITNEVGFSVIVYFLSYALAISGVRTICSFRILHIFFVTLVIFLHIFLSSLCREFSTSWNFTL